MNLTEFKQEVLAAQRDDWTIISTWGSGAGPSYRDSIAAWSASDGSNVGIEVDSHCEVYSLKSNLLISMACGIQHNDKFVEPWLKNFLDASASSAFVDFFFTGQLVYRDVYVIVDGGRSRVPLPEVELDSEKRSVVGYSVSRERVQLFRVLNQDPELYDRSIGRAAFQMHDRPWMC